MNEQDGQARELMDAWRAYLIANDPQTGRQQERIAALEEAARAVVEQFRTPDGLCWHCDEYAMPLDGPIGALAALLGEPS